MKTLLARTICVSALTLGLAPVTHSAITDPIGDFLPSHLFPMNADLDVVSADVVYNKPAGVFTLTGTMNGAIGISSSAAYVFGFDRGQCTALLAPIASNVLFDSVVLLNANGAGSFSAIVGGGRRICR